MSRHAENRPQLAVAVVQVEAPHASISDNLRCYERQLESLQDPVDLIVLPETFATGFTADPAAGVLEQSARLLEWMQFWARRHECVIAGSLACQDAGSIYNRLVLMGMQGALGHYDKVHLFRPSNEHRRYQAGSKRPILHLHGWRILPMICYDLRFPLFSTLTDRIDLILLVANWPRPRHDAFVTLSRARAIENQCCMIAVNRLGTDSGGWSYQGGSMVLDAQGVAQLTAGEVEGISRTVIDRRAMERFRAEYPFHVDAVTDFEDST